MQEDINNEALPPVPPPLTEGEAEGGEAKPAPKPPGFLRLWWRRRGRQTLFYLTILTTLFVGYNEVISFHVFKYGGLPAQLTSPFEVLLYPPILFWTLAYAAAILGFLTAHEMGHYLFCRLHGLEATLPYYLPNPIIFGTFGAVIRIKSPIRNKRQLFDIGAAGPLSGFAVAVPVYLLGLATSIRLPPGTEIGGGIFFGEPLVQKLLSLFIFPGIGEHEIVVVSPLALVGGFGCLVTAINLLPVSQRDGGHVLYAVFGRKHEYVSLVVVIGMIAVALVTAYYGWLLWALLVTLLGLRHPAPANESVKLDFKRRVLAAVVLLVFIGSFTPVPVEVPELFEEGVEGAGMKFIDPPAQNYGAAAPSEPGLHHS